jgi:3-hydroxyacyl-[acyl-carrier-protein] dehydratase
MNEMSASTSLGIAEITRLMELLPHRYPMLMIDRVVDFVPGHSGVGIKNVTINEPHFQGHFPNHPVMPGVLIVEAMAQTAGALVMYSLNAGLERKVVYFMTIDKCRFRHPVVPGDQLRIPVHILRRRGSVWKFTGEAFVGETLVAEAEFSAMVVDMGERAELPPE